MALVLRIVWHGLLGAAVLAAVVVLWARYLPAAHPWLDRAGVLEPLRSTGLVPPPQSAGAPGNGPGAGPPGGGPPRGPVVVVAEAPGERLAFDRLAAIGTGQARHAVTVTAEVPGRITAVRVASGARVAAGDVLAELDRETEEIAVDRARLVLDDARDRLARLVRLQSTGAATDLQIREAGLQMRQAELALREADFALSRRTLRAPIAGHVGIIGVETGQQVTPTTEIARIDDRTRLVVAFRIPERFVGRIGPGDAVEARPLASPVGERLPGVIRALDSRVDETTRTILVQAELDNSDDRLRAGMAFEIAREVTGTRHPTVPPLAVQWSTQGAFVWVVREGRALRLPVRIVQRTAEAVLVEAAFEPGDRVVREGVQMLRPGAEVEVAGEAAEAAAPRPRT